MRRAFLTFAILLGSFGGVPARAQDAAAVTRWNEMLAQVIRATADPVKDLTPEVLAGGAKAAHALLASEPPAGISPERWRTMQATAYEVLGWAGVMDLPSGRAYDAFVQSLQLDPTNVRVSLELGRVLLQTNPPRCGEAIFQQARAAVYDGPGGLPAAEREHLEQGLISAFERCHGRDPDAFERLKTLARSNALPPKDFVLEERHSPQVAPTSVREMMMGKRVAEITLNDGSAMAAYVTITTGGDQERAWIGPDKANLVEASNATIDGRTLRFETPWPASVGNGESLVYHLSLIEGLSGSVRAADGRVVGKIECRRDR